MRSLAVMDGRGSAVMRGCGPVVMRGFMPRIDPFGRPDGVGAPQRLGPRVEPEGDLT
jgi:hypothetical protein